MTSENTFLFLVKSSKYIYIYFHLSLIVVLSVIENFTLKYQLILTELSLFADPPSGSAELTAVMRTFPLLGCI